MGKPMGKPITGDKSIQESLPMAINFEHFTENQLDTSEKKVKGSDLDNHHADNQKQSHVNQLLHSRGVTVLLRINQ